MIQSLPKGPPLNSAAKGTMPGTQKPWSTFKAQGSHLLSTGVCYPQEGSSLQGQLGPKGQSIRATGKKKAKAMQLLASITETFRRAVNSHATPFEHQIPPEISLFSLLPPTFLIDGFGKKNPESLIILSRTILQSPKELFKKEPEVGCGGARL